MSTGYGTTRWWEYYAVRYLMPSVAGVAIVKWLCSHGGNKLLPLLSLPLAGERIDSASLILLFLYGNLFCYVASYPILVFHATRVLDFAKDQWVWNISNGYVATAVLAALAFFSTLAPLPCRYGIAFTLASLSLFSKYRACGVCFLSAYSLKDVRVWTARPGT
jgi:hypothetical protein